MRAGVAPIPSLPLAFCLVAALGLAPRPSAAQQPVFAYGGLAGYQDGVAVQGFVTAREIAPGLPVEVRLRVGRTSVEAGSSSQARRVFINNATNGTPVESGRTWDLGLDLMVRRGERSRLWAGLRQSRFLANFKYVGGNEDFDVTSRHWGVAAGAEAAYPLGRRLELVVSGGGEYYFPSRLQGHDTSYAPDGDHVNPREDFTYDDADAAVGQPRWRPVVLVGVSWRRGP
ncbi:MAG: hypothetical protein AMXMBFR53_32730 [Gemmatimonadota bacterium]